MSLEGQQLDRYRILRLLGSGGMGEVYLAEDARIEQQVAIKVIRAQASPYPNNEASQEAARLFQREAKAIVKLDHPHILPLYDYGEERLGTMTIIYLVMPYRKEGSLTDWLRQRGQAGLLSPQDVAHLVGQAASALQHAHDHQIIHQDVKPSNFLIRHRPEKPERPDLLLADFGIARFTTATSAMSQTIRGTPIYMAPEQWEGQPVPATDQYALAVMTYELLTGRTPFQGGERQVMYQHLMVPPTPPSTLNPQLSKQTDRVLLHALAKHPQARFASITAFADAFQQAAQAISAAGGSTRPAVPPTPPPGPAPASSGDLRAVLAISTAEAQAGTTRTLTLPRGRQVTVRVPAGVHDGQIVRLDGQGEPSLSGGPRGALILSLLVKSTEEAPSLPTASTAGAEQTVLMANPPPAPTREGPTVRSTGQQPRGSNMAQPEMTLPASPSTLPTQAAPSASQAPPAAPQSAPAPKPALGRPDEQPWEPPAPPMTQPQRGISRRKVVLGLAGLAVVGAAGGGLLWRAHPQPGGTPPPSTYPGHSATKDNTHACLTPPSNMVSWWPGDGNANDIWDGNNGTLVGDVTFAPGMVGQAFSFNSQGAQVVVPHHDNQNPGAQMSVNAWIYLPNALGTGFTTASIINKRSPSNNEGYTFELVNGSGGDARNGYQPVNNGVQFEITTPNGAFVNAITGSNVIGPGQWYFVAATYDGTAVRVFVNGVQVAIKSLTGNVNPVTADLVIGRNSVNGATFPGLIDEVELFTKALSATEIQSIFHAGSAGQCKPGGL